MVEKLVKYLHRISIFNEIISLIIYNGFNRTMSGDLAQCSNTRNNEPPPNLITLYHRKPRFELNLLSQTINSAHGIGEENSPDCYKQNLISAMESLGSKNVVSLNLGIPQRKGLLLTVDRLAKKNLPIVIPQWKIFI